MTRRLFPFALAPIFLAALAFGQPNPAQPQHALAPVLGVWRGQFDGLPGVTLVVTDENGSLQGAILFYLHMRKTVNDPYTSTPGLPEPIFNPRFDGKTLTFRVSHRRAHPPRTLSDPPMTFRLALTGPGQAEFVNGTEKGPQVTMVRSDD